MLTRRRLLATGAVVIPSLGFLLETETPALAAMGARIDSPLKVYKNGVVVTGTIAHWDSDEASAVFVAHITQDGQVAVGKSGHVQAGAAKFGLWATGELHPGPATGHGTAHITNKNGSTETYSWTVPVTLTH